MKKLLHFTLPVLLFSLIWGAVEFLVPVVYSEANISVAMVSILFAITSALSLLLDIPAGRLSDKIGRERLITISMMIAAVALGMLYFFSSLWAFIASSILIGIAYGLNWSPILAFIGDRTGDNNHGGVFGDFFTLNSLGEAIAPIVTVLIIATTRTTFPFIVLAGIAMICAVVFMRLIPKQQHVVRSTLSTDHFSYRKTIALVKKSPLVSLFLFSAAFLTAFFWQSVWFTQPLIGFYENTLLDSALIVAAFSLPTILFAKPLGNFIDRMGEKKVFFTSIIATIISFLCFYASETLVLKIVFIFIASIGILAIWLILDIITVKINAKEDMGEFFGILETIRDLSYTVTPLFIGISYQAIGLNGVFIVNAAISGLLLIFGIYAFKRFSFK